MAEISVYDDGTMSNNVDELRDYVVGQKIVAVRRDTSVRGVTEIELADGRVVELVDSRDCCAFTEIETFFLDPSRVDHIVTGVGTTDGYDTWHIFCDYGDILKLTVDWSPGNPFYYGFGFTINVREKGVKRG